MPYASMKDINPALKGIKPKITLAQANLIAKWADAMERAEDGPESPWAAAIAQFKKLYRVEGGKWVKRKVKESSMASYRGYFTSGSATVEISALDVGGEKVPVGDLVAAYWERQGEPGGQGDMEDRGRDGAQDDAEMGEAVWTTKFVNDLPDSSFAVILPGGEKDEEGKTVPRSLRKLPYKDAAGKVDVPHLRNALARLAQPKTDIPANLRALALKKLQAAAKKHLKTYQAEMQAVDLAVCLVESFGVEFDEEMEEIQLSESASGHAVALAEAGAVTGGPRAPLLMDVALIRPGWGNKKDNHYYSREVLARDAKVFEGAKMYATDHRPGEKSVRTEVSVVKGITGFGDDGAPIASVAVHDPDFAESIRNRKQLGTLETLECSILATGRTKKGKAPDGRKGNIVEAITSATSVDWVTKAGAGGHAVALAENNAGGDDMSEETTTQEQEQEEGAQEATLSEDRQQEVTYLAESEVKAALEASRLPRQAQSRLAEVQYLDAEALKAAVEAERAYIKEITGSGKPFAQGQTAAADATMSEAEYDAEYDDILRRHGLFVPQKEAA